MDTAHECTSNLLCLNSSTGTHNTCDHIALAADPRVQENQVPIIHWPLSESRPFKAFNDPEQTFCFIDVLFVHCAHELSL